MRKTLTSLLALALLISVLAVPVAAQSGTDLVVTATTTETQVSVEVIAVKETFCGSFTLCYDPAALTYENVQASGTVSAISAGEGTLTVTFASESRNAAAPGETVATVVFTRVQRVLDTEIAVTLEDLNSQEGMHLALPAVYLNSGLPFTDVSRESWYYEAVAYGYNAGLFHGVAETLFEPDGAMTRAMFVTTLARMAGVEEDNTAETPFTDVDAGSYYAGAVAWAAEAGIVKDTSDTTFSPYSQITREQMVTMLYRYVAYLGEDTATDTGVLDDFADCGSISGWALDAMAWAVEQSIIQGTGKGLEPRSLASRAQAAQLLMNFDLWTD